MDAHANQDTVEPTVKQSQHAQQEQMAYLVKIKEHLLDKEEIVVANVSKTNMEPLFIMELIVKT